MVSDAIKRLQATYKRSGETKSNTKWPVLETSPEANERLTIKRYYDIVIRDRSKAEEALNYYRIVIENAYQHVTAVGNLSLLAQETPGLQALYGGVHIDSSQIRKYLEEVLNTEKARKIKWFMGSPDAKRQYGEMKITEAKNWTEAEDSICDLNLLVRRFANAENQLGNIMQGFTTRGIMIAKLVSIREAGLEEVWVDPTRETVNE